MSSDPSTVGESDELDPIPPSIYFGGCGFGAAFYVGVHRAMVERWGKDFYKHTTIAGGSAGAIMAIQVALGRDSDQLADMYLWTAREAQKRGPIFSASGCLIESVRRVLDEFTEDVHTILNDKCYISVTEFPFRHRFCNSWRSEEDLLECLTATCHIPIYTHRARDTWSSVVDGAYGFAGESLVDLHHNDTLFVGIDPTADVGRSLTFSQMLYPLLDKDFDEVVESGYRAMKAWHRHKKQDKVGRRIPNYPVLIIVWFCRLIQIIFDFIMILLYPVFMALRAITGDRATAKNKML